MHEHIDGIVPPMTTPFQLLLPMGNRARIMPAGAIAAILRAGVPRAPMPATSEPQARAIRQALVNAGLL